MNCPKCGKESVKDALYCAWCGAVLKPQEQNVEKYVIYNSRKKYSWAIVGIIGIICSGLFVLSNTAKELAEYTISGSGHFLSGNAGAFRTVGWLILIIFVPLLVAYLWDMKKEKKSPILILDSEDIFSPFRNNGYKGKIGWNEITEVYIKPMCNARFLFIDIETKNDVLESSRKYARLEHRSMKKRKYKTAIVSIEQTDLSDEDFIEVLHTFQKEYKDKR